MGVQGDVRPPGGGITIKGRFGGPVFSAQPELHNGLEGRAGEMEKTDLEGQKEKGSGDATHGGEKRNDKSHDGGNPRGRLDAGNGKNHEKFLSPLKKPSSGYRSGRRE